ncbi:hypothetical protein, partial [Chromobacterium subtsugae]|uniref:hypothetical protein n=1 Tax=Chromobacterium subtsugae TaxID=251747 RepID=UPI001C0FE054
FLDRTFCRKSDKQAGINYLAGRGALEGIADQGYIRVANLVALNLCVADLCWAEIARKQHDGVMAVVFVFQSKTSRPLKINHHISSAPSLAAALGG